MSRNLADMRRDYTRDGLSEAQAPLEPFALFEQWFADAVKTYHSYYHICKRRDHRLMNSRHFKRPAPGSVSFHKKKITKAGQLFQDLLFRAGNLGLSGLMMCRDNVSVLFYKPA